MAGWAPTSPAIHCRLSPTRYINTHSASGARRNFLSMTGVILPGRRLEGVPLGNVLMPQGLHARIGLFSIYPIRLGPPIRRRQPMPRRAETLAVQLLPVVGRSSHFEGNTNNALELSMTRIGHCSTLWNSAAGLRITAPHRVPRRSGASSPRRSRVPSAERDLMAYPGPSHAPSYLRPSSRVVDGVRIQSKTYPHVEKYVENVCSIDSKDPF